MSISEEIKNIDISSASSAGVFFFSILGPGVLVVFLFQRELFISLETMKLVLFSLAISSPGVIVPYVVSAICNSVLIHKKVISSGQLGNGKEWFY